VMVSQLMPSAEDVTSFWGFGIIEIELSIHFSGISVLGAEWDAAARDGHGSKAGKLQPEQQSPNSD